MQITKQTWLPCFKGFYNDYYYNDDYLLQRELDNISVNFENIQEDILKFINNTFYDCINYNDFNIDFLKAYCDNLSDNNINFEFETISSPKYYNFNNDSCNVTVIIKNWELIQKFINTNLKDFKTYLEDNYTSCSGFWSHYPNDLQYWLNIVNNPNNDNYEHEIGSILQFYYDYTEENADFNASDNGVYIESYIDYDKLLMLFNSEFNTDFLSFEDVLKCNSLSINKIDAYKFKKILSDTNLKLI
jgi:hypothetical protein